ncbi:hypothetical protein MesoLj131b_59730 [Mesorhizobium sp. 131-2-5]|jgi:hypothetical protein|nr:hypothetical protein MesoLj131b_59730 [Mesorhizobium sp. 131-2-5]
METVTAPTLCFDAIPDENPFTLFLELLWPVAVDRTAANICLQARGFVGVRAIYRSGIATGRIGVPVAPRSLMQAPKKANS